MKGSGWFLLVPNLVLPNSSSFEPKMGEAMAQPQWKDSSPLAHGSARDRHLLPWDVR